MIAGIDYGSKLSGYTAIAIEDDERILILSSEKDKDADRWLEDVLIQYPVEQVYIDAPLSLPAAYFGKGSDFMFRHCDKVTKAMSPMFLGGLTARAMKLANALKSRNVIFRETYPAQTVFRLSSQDLYNKKSNPHPQLLQEMEDRLGKPFHFERGPARMHEVDAILALYAGKLHQKGIATVVGDPEEGQIIY
jgi:predicted nuclease with RNAse H fold